MKNQFRTSGAIVTLLVLVLLSLVWQFGLTVWHGLLSVLQTQGFYQFAAVVSTCLLGGKVSGLKRRMPGYGGRPPRAALKQHLVEPAMTALLNLVLTVCIGALLAVPSEVHEFRTFVLNVCIGLNLGMMGWCLWLGVSLTGQYRSACAWEDLVHPR